MTEQQPGKNNPLISLCLIARNEAGNLARCLESVKELADEMIVVDTGSTDNTIEIARELGAKVYEFPWIDDFSAALNFALSKASGSWILNLGADEYVEPEELSKIRNALVNSVEFIEITVKDSGGEMLIPSVRLFRNNGYHYKRRIHERLDIDSLINSENYFVSDIVITHAHVGSTQSSGRSSQNLKLCLAELEEDPGDVDILYWTGYEYERHNDQANALRYYSMAIEADNNKTLPLSARNYAVILEKQGDLRSLYPFLEFALEKYPDFMDLKFIYGRSLIKNNDIQEAIKYLEDCVYGGGREDGWLVADSSPAWLSLGYAYYVSGMNEQAKLSLKKVLNKHPRDLEAMIYLLSVYIDELGVEYATNKIVEYVDMENDQVKETLNKIKTDLKNHD